jgi:hypothetical protein
LRLQGSQFRERRIRIRLALAPIRTRPDILMTRRFVRFAMAGRILTALRAARAPAAILPGRSGPVRPIFLPVVLTALLRRRIRPGCRLLTRRNALRRGSLGAIRSPLTTLLPPAMMRPMRTFLAVFEAAWPPHLDHFRFCGDSRHIRTGGIGRRGIRAWHLSASGIDRCAFRRCALGR